IGRNGGRRIYIAGDDTGHDPDFFAGLNKYFEGVKKEPGILKYALSREIPGLEIVYANDGYSVATVWGDANGINVAASEKAIREKVKREVAAIDDPDNKDEAADDGTPPGELSPAAQAALKKRRWEGYAWYSIAANSSLDSAAPPAGVDIIPSQGADQEAWKAHSGSVTVRASEDGLYKVQAGRSTKIGDGGYSHPVVSADGRWLFVDKVDGDAGQYLLIRVDLSTRREYPIVIENAYGEWTPKAFLPGTNAVVIEHRDYDEISADDEDTPPDAIDPTAFKLIDAVTGNELQTRGEVRPFAQQSFRPLQHAAKPGELWVAIPDSEANATDVGTVDTRTLTFAPVLRVPKIKFDSMGMWADEAHQKIYFVYRGHLLSLPMKVDIPRPARPPLRRHT
ncbi:MAG: hypothetical protein ACJ73D_01215, partial [Pyrinomonadaceae bacterium]